MDDDGEVEGEDALGKLYGEFEEATGPLETDDREASVVADGGEIGLVHESVRWW